MTPCLQIVDASHLPAYLEIPNAVRLGPDDDQTAVTARPGS
jgi:hypothetical protein